MGKYRGLIITIIVVAVAMAAIGIFTVKQFPGLIPSHTIRTH
jgi:hypothetical protein